jgi:endonuclease III
VKPTNKPLDQDRLSDFLKNIRQSHPGEPLMALEPIDQLVRAFLQWDATRVQAEQTHEKIRAEVVDNNELRVCHPPEIQELLGPRYPKPQERAERLIDALNTVYIREHATSLESLNAQPVDEVEAYLESLVGMTPYVAALVMLACYEQHRIPVDDKLAAQMAKEGVVPQGTAVQDLAEALADVVAKGEALEVHASLQAWSDATAVPQASRQRSTSVSPERISRYNKRKERRSRAKAQAHSAMELDADDDTEPMSAYGSGERDNGQS